MISQFNLHLKDILTWHFSEETGSNFWLERKEKFDFDPINDINFFEDLYLFPDVTEDLKITKIDDLIPKKFKQKKFNIIESGGTSGPPKRLIVFDEWLDLLTSWRLDNNFQMFNKGGFNMLASLPSGPHIVSLINKKRVETLGGNFFTIDMDPRWVKKMILEDIPYTKEYVNHLMEQIENIINTQIINCIVLTPPLLEQISLRDDLLYKLEPNLKLLICGGTYLNADILSFLSEQIFKNVEIQSSYGNTMKLGECKSRKAELYNGNFIFDSFFPYIIIDVVSCKDKTRNKIKDYQRGQIVSHHLSRYAFLPNILERDTAIKIPNGNSIGASVADVKTLTKIGGVTMIEGVY